MCHQGLLLLGQCHVAYIDTHPLDVFTGIVHRAPSFRTPRHTPKTGHTPILMILVGSDTEILGVGSGPECRPIYGNGIIIIIIIE